MKPGIEELTRSLSLLEKAEKPATAEAVEIGVVTAEDIAMKLEIGADDERIAPMVDRVNALAKKMGETASNTLDILIVSANGFVDQKENPLKPLTVDDVFPPAKE
jgi:hypothetical protein